MNKPSYPRFQTRTTALDNNHSSCLTLNQPGSTLGLSNLLDLIGHEICQEDDQQVHRLTFKSGQTLWIKADSRMVTVRGQYINFRSECDSSLSTLLGDPARKVRQPA